MPSLNYDPKDPKFILLGKIFDFTDSKKSLNCLSRAGVKNRVKVMFCIKTLLMAMYFDYTVSVVLVYLQYLFLYFCFYLVLYFVFLALL